MSLRYALLSLLEAGPMTGYELAKLFDASAGYLWYAQHSQIYPELRRMEAEGLVLAEPQPRGERATKRPYTLTVAGAEALVAWVRREEAVPPLRDGPYLKATYLEYGSFGDARRHFRAHRAHYQALQEHWTRLASRLQERESPLIRRRLERAPPAAQEAIVAFKVHGYEGLIERARSEIAWADRGLALVDHLEPPSEVPPGEPVLRPKVLRDADGP